MARSDAPERIRHIKVRDVPWEEIVFPDDRRCLEIARPDCEDGVQDLDVTCECGAGLYFIRAEAWMNQPETCCCGGCRIPMLLVTGACPGCDCDDCTARGPCELIGEEMAFRWEGDQVRVFFDPVPVAEG